MLRWTIALLGAACATAWLAPLVLAQAPPPIQPPAGQPAAPGAEVPAGAPPPIVAPAAPPTVTAIPTAAPKPKATPAATVNENWPVYDDPFQRGPGYYLSFWKILGVWLVFALWVSTTDWINRDCLTKNFNDKRWNPVTVFTFVFGFTFLFVFPMFIVGYLVMILTWAGPFVGYVLYRNGQVPDDEKVFTQRHLKLKLARVLAKVGVKIDVEEKDPHAAGPDVQLLPMGAANDRDDNINLLTARQSDGFLMARELFFDAITRRADGVMLESEPETVSARYQIDGVWHNVAPMPKTDGDMLLAVLKTLANINPDEAITRRAGRLGVDTSQAKFIGRLSCQATAGGERTTVVLEGKKLSFNTLDEAGMRPKMQEQISELLSRKNGMLVITSMPGGGLTTTFDLVLNSVDRYTRNFIAVEDARA